MTNLAKISIGLYLIRRLKQLGIKHVFGIPGDFNLEFLDLVEEEEGIEWIGGCNELNAGYAADGYARINKISALITTYGVGELSATNAIAGSYAEMIPVVHIVGFPSTKAQSKGILHHSLDNDDVGVYMKMYEKITVAQTNLSQENAKSEIDRVLRECCIRARPVYISISSDVHKKEIEVAENLSDDPLNLSLPENPYEVEYAAIVQIYEKIRMARRIIVLADVKTIRCNATNELLDFVEATGFPVYTPPMGKGAISENHPLFRGTYNGNASEPHVKREVEEADLIIFIGALKTDFNTGGHTSLVATEKTIEILYDRVKVFFAVYENIFMKQFLSELTSRLKHLLPGPRQILPPYQSQPLVEETNSQQITHNWLWREISSKFLKPNDIIIAETGTSMFGLASVKIPEGAILINQMLYASIGYSVGATLGATLAAKNDEIKRRVILFVGDGSLQVTAQEISIIIRNRLNPIIFVLNNDGYTIERLIHGRTRGYNDIQPWLYHKTLEYFGGERRNGIRVSTKEELESFISDSSFDSFDQVQLVEVIVNKFDGPNLLFKVIENLYN